MKPTTMKKLQLKRDRYHVNRFFKHLKTRGGIVNGKAVLFIYDKKHPELSYIVTEKL